jgi:hypothetical protein
MVYDRALRWKSASIPSKDASSDRFKKKAAGAFASCYVAHSSYEKSEGNHSEQPCRVAARLRNKGIGRNFGKAH